jgi:hypothetical protein
MNAYSEVQVRLNFSSCSSIQIFNHNFSKKPKLSKGIPFWELQYYYAESSDNSIETFRDNVSKKLLLLAA